MHKGALKALVLDASVLINLVASEQMEVILCALSKRRVVMEPAFQEVNVDPRNRSRSLGLLGPFVASGVLSRLSLGQGVIELHLELTGADPPDDLGEGEAATIAYATTNECVAIIDDTKAIGICRRRFSSLRVMTTVELFRRPEVLQALGQDGFVEAVFRALRFARMRVPSEHDPWIRRLLGAERVALCPSIKRKA